MRSLPTRPRVPGAGDRSGRAKPRPGERRRKLRPLAKLAATIACFCFLLHRRSPLGAGDHRNARHRTVTSIGASTVICTDATTSRLAPDRAKRPAPAAPGGYTGRPLSHLAVARYRWLQRLIIARQKSRSSALFPCMTDRVGAFGVPKGLRNRGAYERWVDRLKKLVHRERPRGFPLEPNMSICL